MKKRVRRILSFILTAVMIFALLPVIGNPMVVKAEDTPAEHVAHDEQCSAEETDCKYHKDWTKISTWTELKSLGEKGGSGYLVDNIKISETFTIAKGKTVNLCLNGYSITQTEDVNTITVFGTLNLYDKKDNLGIITHASTKIGSGVRIEDNGTFTMNGGTISGNKAIHGGGVDNNGTFTMTWGTISGNNTVDGGGVYNFNNGTFTMTEGTISGNNASYGGGVYNANKGTFTMEGGTISGNEAKVYGGGVSNKGTFTMTWGTISGNNTVDGGGVYNKGTFTMNGGTISGNNATNGGGVYNSGYFFMTDGTISGNNATWGGGVNNQETFIMKDGTISKNRSSYGGGVYIYFGTFEMGHGDISNNQAVYGGGVFIDKNHTTEFKMEDGTISENSAYIGGGVYCMRTFEMKGGSISKNVCDPGLLPSEETVTYSANGGGVYVNGYFAKFKPSGKSVICDNTKKEDYGNTANNVYLEWGYRLKFETDGLDASAKIGITTEARPTINEVLPFTDGLDLTGTPKGTLENFFSDNKAFKVAEGSNGEASLVRSGYSIVFMPNGGSGNMEPQFVPDDQETATLTDNAYTREGNRFIGWNTEAGGSGTSYNDKAQINIGSDLTLYAQWSDVYSVKLYTNGGTVKRDDCTENTQNEIYTTQYKYGVGLTLPGAGDIEKQGYTFAGWEDSSQTLITSISATESEDKDLTAIWEENKYTVKFDANGGEGTMDNQSRKYDDKAALTANAFTYEGKTFDCWNTAADGSGTPYKDEELGNLSITDNDTVTLYAQWTTDTFTISWKNYDGTVLETDKNVAYGSTPSYDGETPVRAKEGNKEYTFTGWTPEVDTVKGAATYTATYSEEVVEQTEPETPQNPTEPETPEEPEEEIPEKDWLDDLRLALRIADELGGPQTVEYSGDFALPYEIMNFLVNHPDITFVYHVTYEGQEYTITIPAGKAVAYADTPWYGPLWLLANYGGNNAPTGAKGNGTYIVKAGDTLTGISVKLGLTIQYLVDKNGIKNPDYIVEGQELIY